MSTTAPAPFSGTLKLETYPNRFNTVVPPEGPFYRTGLKLTSTGTNPRPLTEGLDYYLCYYFKEAAEALKDQVFGGIMLITETSCNYTIYSVGREYRVPQSEIGKFLVNPDMKDPRNIDWSELMRYAPVVAPIDPPTSLEEAILRDDVVKALDDIRKGILERAGELDEAYTEVTELIFANGKKIFDDNMYQHHMVKNAHQYTAEEVGALKVLTKAVDATKAFGKTIDELVDLMKRNGIQQTHIDTLMPVVLGELRGRLKVLSNGALTFRTSDSSHVITLQGDKFLITTTKPITITADADKNEPGIGVEVTSGLNAMYALSGAKAPIFNGAYLITPDMVSLYLSAVKLLPANAYFSSTDSVKIYGSAKDYSPVNMTGVVPTATTAIPGLLLVTSVSANISAGAAISQAAVTALKTTLDNYVDATYKVNNKGFVTNPTTGNQELTLSASDLGLGNVDNTTPNEKPVTTAIRAVLNTKALSGHTHTFADLTGVPTASDTVAGLVQLWDAIDATTDKVVTSKQGYNVQTRINTLKATVNQLLPSWTTGGAQYGNRGFLPIPTVSNYAGFGFNPNEINSVVYYEDDIAYYLRNGFESTEDTNRVYYSYVNVNADGTFKGGGATSLPYHPVGLSGFPGVVLRRILVSCDQGAIFKGSDNRYYLVLFDGTLNDKKHTKVSEVSFPDMVRGGVTVTFASNDRYKAMSVVKGKVIVTNSIAQNDRFWVGAWELAAAAVVSGKSINATLKTLTAPMSTDGFPQFCNDGVVSDSADDKRLGYATPEARAKWGTSFTVNNYPPSVFQAAKDNVIRVRVEMHGRASNNLTAIWQSVVSVVYTINVDTGAVTLETDIFPIQYDVADRVLDNPVASRSVLNTNAGVASYHRLYEGGGFLFAFRVGVYDRGEPTVTSYPANGKSLFDILGEATTYNAKANKSAGGSVPSAYRQYMRGAIHLGGTDKLVAYRDRQVGNGMVARYDTSKSFFPDFEGYGPDNYRYALDAGVYQELCRTPTVFKNGVLTNNGRLIEEPGTYPYKTIPGTTTWDSDKITVSAGTWTALQNAIAAAVPASTDALVTATQLKLNVFDVGGVNAAFAIFTVCSWDNADQKYRHNRVWIWKVPMSVATGNDLTLNVNGMIPVLANWMHTTAGFEPNSRIWMQSKMVQRGDGYVFMLANSLFFPVVGDARYQNFLVTCDTSYGDWTVSSGYTANPDVAELDIFVMPETGYIVETAWIYGALYLGGTCYKNMSRTWKTGTSAPTIIGGVMTAEGWELYITEDERLRFGAEYFTVPVYNENLQTKFPGEYQNATFYMHVQVVNGIPSYVLSKTQLTDTATRLYIGFVKTDNVRIVDTQFMKVKRLGGLKQMLEHAGTEYRHDVDRHTDQALSPLGLLRKEPLIVPGATPAYLDARYSNSVISPQKRSERRATIIKTPRVFADGEVGDPVADFFPAAKAVAAQSSENSAAATAGILWVGADLPDLGGSFNWSARPQVTPTKSKIRIRVYIPANIAGATTNVGINGQWTPVTHGSSATIDLVVTPGKKLLVRITGSVTSQNWRVWGSKWMGFTISDFDEAAGTETQLTTSGVSTPLIYNAVNHVLPNIVLRAETIDLGVNTNDFWPIVSAGNCSCSPPVIVTDNATTIKVATTWVSLSGLETATDIAVNLMPRL